MCADAAMLGEQPVKPRLIDFIDHSGPGCNGIKTARQPGKEGELSKKLAWAQYRDSGITSLQIKLPNAHRAASDDGESLNAIFAGVNLLAI